MKVKDTRNQTLDSLHKTHDLLFKLAMSQRTSNEDAARLTEIMVQIGAAIQTVMEVKQ